jgi:hypothetical protein
MNMLAPKARTNLPFESNFWIGAQESEDAAGEQTVVPDPVEPVCQDVHEEAADELARLERHGLVAAGPLDPVVLVPEGDAGGAKVVV